MNFFECSIINGIGGSGSKVIVTCSEAFAGTTISCTKRTLIYTQTCPFTSPYQVAFEGLENGTWTISGTAGGQTWTSEVIVEDIAVDLIYGFDWRKWLTEGRVTQTFESLDDILEDEPTLRQLFLVHDSVDYLAGTTVITDDVAKIFNTDLAAKWINNSDYALDHFYAVADIKTVMDEADKYGYGEWVITDDSTTPPTWGAKGNVPVMTANSAPYGTASASYEHSTYKAWKMFDGDVSTQGATKTSADTNPGRVAYKFTTPINVRKFKYTRPSTATATANYKIQYSDDGSTWNDAYTGYSSGQTAEEVIPDFGYHLYWALYLISFSTGAWQTYGNQLQFYGRELKVSVPTMTSNTAPFGEAFESSYDYVDSYYLLQAWRAFDKDISNALSRFQANGKSNQYLGYTFSSPTVIKLVALTNYSIAARSPKEIKIQYKNGDVWIDATDIITNPTTADLTTFYILSNESQVASRDWRVFILNNYGDASYISIRELQFYGLDYSEKEFEAGTTKKWLYDHGVELETASPVTVGNNTVATKNEDNLYIEIPASTSRYAGFVFPSISLTPFSLLRGVLDDIGYSSNASSAFLRLTIEDTASPTYSTTSLAVATFLMSDGALPNNLVLNINSINQNAYPTIGDNCATSTVNKKASIKELWLE